MSAARPIPSVTERQVGLLVLLATAACIASGAVLAVRYRPGELGWLRTVHAGAAAVAVISAIAGRVVGVGGRLRPSVRGLVMLALLVVLLGAAFTTGTSLAWQGGTPADIGMFLDAGRRVRAGSSSVSGGAVRWLFVVHVVVSVLPMAVAVRRALARPAAHHTDTPIGGGS